MEESQNREKRHVQANSRSIRSSVTHILDEFSRNSCIFRVISSLLLAQVSLFLICSFLFSFFFFFFFGFCRKQAVPFENPRFRGFLFDYRSCVFGVSRDILLFGFFCKDPLRSFTLRESGWLFRLLSSWCPSCCCSWFLSCRWSVTGRFNRRSVQSCSML